MKVLAALFITTLGIQSALAGSAQTHLNCREIDDKISLSGDIPGDSNDFDLSLKKGKQVSRIYSVTICNPQGCNTEANGKISVVEALNKGVYTVKAHREGESLANVDLYALPKTVRLKNKPNGQSSRFGGVLKVYDQALGSETEKYNVLCETEYAI